MLYNFNVLVTIILNIKKTTASHSQFTFDEFISIPGCIYVWANNYNELATIDDGSCYKMGCNSDWADNYDDFYIKMMGHVH